MYGIIYQGRYFSLSWCCGQAGRKEGENRGDFFSLMANVIVAELWLLLDSYIVTWRYTQFRWQSWVDCRQIFSFTWLSRALQRPRSMQYRLYFGWCFFIYSVWHRLWRNLNTDHSLTMRNAWFGAFPFLFCLAGLRSEGYGNSADAD